MSNPPQNKPSNQPPHQKPNQKPNQKPAPQAKAPAKNKPEAASRCQRCGQLQPCVECYDLEQTPLNTGIRFLDILWGCGQILKQPELRNIALLPVFLSGAALAGGLFWSYQQFNHWFGQMLQQQMEQGALSSVLWGLSSALGGLAIVLAFVFLFIPLLGLVCLPFFDPLAARTEVALLGKSRSAAALNLKQLAKEIVLLLGFKLVILVPSLLLLLIPLAGPMLFTAVMAMLMSFDFLDVIWMRRGYSFADKLRFIQQNLIAWILFWLPLCLMLWIPLLQILMLPGAVVGATRFYLSAKKS